MECPHLAIWINDHLQSNALRVESVLPEKNRCMLRQPERLKRFDPSGTRWLFSGGSPLHFGECDCDDSSKCPRRQGF